MATPQPISGFVLAGGRSSRMGADKALLPLAGQPLIALAAAKLLRVCTNVHILSGNPALAAYAPLIPDLHPGCGPIGGMEAALTQSPTALNLFLAVDMPFLPTAFIRAALSHWLHSGSEANLASIFLLTADDRPQPGFCLLHKDIAPFLTEAIAQQDFKLMRVFQSAGRELALRRGTPPESCLSKLPSTSILLPPIAPARSDWTSITPAQKDAEPLWFANLNTPEDFAEAEARAAALEL